MNAVGPTVEQEFALEARTRLTASLEKIRHCLDQLTDEQVWWRAAESHNSIGNIVLHLCGNLRQWIVSGVGGAADERDRPAEFAQRELVPATELLAKLEYVAQQVHEILRETNREDLLRRRKIQGFDVSGLSAIFDSLSHLAGHVQEIVFITRLQLGDDYRFHWTPTLPEHGAP